MRRARPLLLVPPALVVALGLDQGGFDPSAWVWAGALGAWAAAMAAVSLPALPASRRGWLWVAAGGALLAWTTASALWSDRRTQTFLEARRTTVYVALALALVAAAQRGSARRIAVLTHAAITGLVVYSLARYLFTSRPVDPFEGTLLAQPLGYANAVGVLAAIGTTLAVGLAVAHGRRLARAATAGSVPVLVAALALTHSRGSVLALAVGLGATTVLARAPRRDLLSLVALGGVAAIAVAGWTQPRTSLWHVAWREFSARPVIGSGAGTFASAWEHSGLVAARGGALDAHSLYLETLAELGIVGLALLAAFLLLPLVPLPRGRPPEVAAAAGAYVVFLVHAGVDWDWEMPAVVVAGLCCGAAVLSGTVGEAAPAPEQRTLQRIAIAALAVVLGVASIVGARSSAEPGVAPPLLVVPVAVPVTLIVAPAPVPVWVGRSDGGARRQRVTVAQMRR